MAPAPPVGKVRVSSKSGDLSVEAWLADERPDVGSGFGGWDVIDRPRRKPLTTWKSSPNLSLTLPILLDNFASGVSVEGEIATVEKMGQSVHGDDPPILTVRASGGAVPFQGREWVLGELAFGDAEMNTVGNRVRQYLTLTLIEHVDDRYLTERSAANRRRRSARGNKGRGAAAKRVVAKRSSKHPKKTTPHSLARTATVDEGDFGTGEDLLTIAARELGDADRWVEIAQLNGLRDPRAITPGQVLRLP